MGAAVIMSYPGSLTTCMHREPEGGATLPPTWNNLILLSKLPVRSSALPGWNPTLRTTPWQGSAWLASLTRVVSRVPAVGEQR
jgi:hypothetical protein